MKFKTIDDIESSLLKTFFEVKSTEELDKKDSERLHGFLNSYSIDQFSTLNDNQLFVLYYMFWQQDQDTENLSLSLGLSRRSAVNSANALTRKMFTYWELPTGSNDDGSYDLHINREFMKTEDYLYLG